MDQLDEVIERFRREPGKRLGFIDKFHLALPDARAFEALLAAATDPSENEDVRCAAWKVWHYDEPEEDDLRERLIAGALATIQKDESSLVCDYAICALSYHAHRTDVEAVLLPLLQDRSASRSMRSAAFQVLSGRGRERREAIFRSLLDDPALREEIEIYFS